MEKKTLSLQLRKLVRFSVGVLGKQIETQFGKQAYQRIEKLRQQYKTLRSGAQGENLKVLKTQLQSLKKLSAEQQEQVAHAFTLMLELMNTCENAYRTYRLQQRTGVVEKFVTEKIIFVLTAHPTEARPPELLAIFDEIQNLLVEALLEDSLPNKERLSLLLGRALQVPIAKHATPTVEQEAQSVYSLCLKPELIEFLLSLKQEAIALYLRSWVGGDKDGHPGVGPKQLRVSLELSRRWLLAYLDERLVQFQVMCEIDPARSAEVSALREQLSELESVRSEDSIRVQKFRAQLFNRLGEVETALGLEGHLTKPLKSFFDLFPGIVIPLELRESVEKFPQSANTSAPIVKMLETLEEIGGNDIRNYARGVIISQVNSASEVSNVFWLVHSVLKSAALPVIPLLEKQSAIEQGSQILTDFLADEKVRTQVQEHWQGRVEVMVGYSDSAKEMGAFPSRYLISERLSDLETYLKSQSLIPIFFHGSGGSIARGGGSIQEQVCWWPQSARDTVKVTVQGEMIQRTFSSPAVLGRKIEKILAYSEKGENKAADEVKKSLVEFSESVRNQYQTLVSDERFLEVVEKATSYQYLSSLKLGSRPSKRTQSVSLKSLRAIPWVLCWTQTRLLLPTWWGVGTAWKSSSPGQKELLGLAFEQVAVFRSFVKLLGFTLAKVELNIWRLYLERSGLDAKLVKEFWGKTERECRLAMAFVRAMSGERNLLWYQPWLGESIRLRTKMIHPLNLLQMIAMQSSNEKLLRQSVTGIASGLLTTG